MSYSFGVAKPVREWQLPPRRQRRQTVRAVDAEKLERDFWRAMDPEKLNSAARGGVVPRKVVVASAGAGA